MPIKAKQRDIINVRQYVTDKEGHKIAAIIDLDELARLKKVLEIIPSSEKWLYENKEAFESVREGLKDLSEGRTSRLNIDEL